MSRVAAIDIGTNTVLLLVAERDERGELRAVLERATITRLGQGVDQSRVLSPEAVARTNGCLDEYARLVREAGATRVAVVGTSAMRDAGGGEAVREHVARVLGVEARVASGDEEARLTFAGALSGLSRAAGDALVFDVGGGSTEVVLGDPVRGAIAFAKSFDVGSVRLTERHIKGDPPARQELDAAKADAARAFAALPSFEAGEPVGIAGTVTTLAAVAMSLEPYDGARVHGSRLTLEALRGVLERLAAMPLEARRKVRGLEPKRADVILAGALVVIAFLEKVGATAMIVSDRGVRWGLAEDLAR